MTALAADFIRSSSPHLAQLLGIPIKASTTVYLGSLVCSDANGLAVPLTDAADLVCRGVAQNSVASGAQGSLSATDPLSGDRCVVVDTTGQHSFPFTGTTPVSGQTAYGIDSGTVSVDPGTNVMVVGQFNQPNPVGGTDHWLVDLVAPR